MSQHHLIENLSQDLFGRAIKQSWEARGGPECDVRCRVVEDISNWSTELFIFLVVRFTGAEYRFAMPLPRNAPLGTFNQSLVKLNQWIDSTLLANYYVPDYCI